MHGRLMPLLVILCAAFALGSCQSSAGARTSPVNLADEASRVRETIDLFFTAAQKRDWDAAAELISPDFEIYTDEAQGLKKDDYVKLLKEDDLVVEQMELTNVSIRVSEDGRMAWAKYHGLFRSTSHGKKVDVKTVETLVFIKEGGAWKMAHAHASVKALDEKRGA